MADLALAAVIRKTVDILGNLAMDEATRLYWLKEDITWIETEMRQMQSFLIDLNAKQSASQGVATLARNVRNLAYDAEDIVDIYIPKLASQNKNILDWVTKRLNCFPCGSRHKFAMEIAGIRRRVKDIADRRTAYGINENTTSRDVEERNPRQSYPHVEVPVVVGFQEYIIELEASLLDANTLFSVTSIIGMPGVGKTTLAKEVYNSVKVNFDCSAWVYISQEPNLIDLLQKIAKQVGLEEQLQKENLEANLFNFLKEKRYLIVLDDIWDVQAWDHLKIGIPIDCKNQSRLVLTSRKKEVGLSVGENSSLHELQPLNPEMSWELFSQFVKIPIDNTYHDELTDLGKQILKRCGGLPLAIVTIGGLLRTKEKTEHAWRVVLNKMGHEKDKICALSYRDLRTVLKPCFLYFGMFPEDHIITVRELINLWVAEGFIQSQGSQTLEEAGEDYLNELICRNLIQVEKRRYDGRIKSCRIHDVLRDLCISIAQEEDFFKIQSGNDSVIRALESRRAAIHQQSIIDDGTSPNHQFPKLRTLLYFEDKRNIIDDDTSPIHQFPMLRSLLYFHKSELYHEPPSILIKNIKKGFRSIRVLRLEGSHTRLPDGIGNLVHIRYLHLSGYMLVLPITMGNLKNLEVLDCAKCEYLTLPTIILKMEKLRHVYIHFTTWFIHASKFSQMKRRFEDAEVKEVYLPNLQTLSCINVDLVKADCFRQLTQLTNLGIFCNWKKLTDILKNTTHLSEKLEKLKCWAVDFSALDFSGYHNLHQLYLEGILYKLPLFPKNLTKLSLENNYLEIDPMKELGMLPKLRVLKLKDYSYKGRVMVISGPDSFPSLELLVIRTKWNLGELKIEDDHDDGDRMMPKLQRVEIGRDYINKLDPKNFTMLTIEENDLKKDPELWMLPKLWVLKLEGDSYMGDVLSSNGSNILETSVKGGIYQSRKWARALSVIYHG